MYKLSKEDILMIAQIGISTPFMDVSYDDWATEVLKKVEKAKQISIL